MELVLNASRDTAFAWMLPFGCAATLVWGSLTLACGGGVDTGSSLTLASIAECRQLGGAPLFDLDDDRPIEKSCPEGLLFVAAFDEEFYGADWGICCVDADAPEEPTEWVAPEEPTEWVAAEEPAEPVRASADVP
jgi:hypothetical protein